MPYWTVDAPASLDFDDVSALRVRLLAGSVAVLATGEKPSVEVTSIVGRPLRVCHEDGILTISYEDLTWEGLLEWLRPQRNSAAVTVAVPENCPIQLGVVSASAVVSGLSAGASVKGVSGEITLDGVTGDVEAQTVSGALEAQSVDGAVRFNSVSGDLTLAGGSLRRLDAETVSGGVAADIDLERSAGVHVSSISGGVTLRLPEDSDTSVRMRSTSGRVRSEFESLRATMSPGSHSVSGNVGAGSGNISVTTVSGAVTLLRRRMHPASQNMRPQPAAPHAEEEMESETR
jgi:Putative adhesin